MSTPISSPKPINSPPLAPMLLRPALKHGSTSNSRPTSPIPTHAILIPGSIPRPVPSFSTPESLGGTGTPRPSVTPGGAGYTTKVSFDTFAAPTESDSMFSFTLQVKSEGYRKTRNTRVYLCAASGDESGKEALEWAIANLVEDGDELVVVRGFDSDDLQRDMHEQVREDAKDLMKLILDRNSEYDSRRLSVIVEFVGGKVTDTIDRMTALYRPDSLVVGTRGQRSLMQTWGAALGAPGVGSVSRYCVSHSPVPVIVVRPERKVKKTVEKRRADPKRRAQFEELTKTRSFSGVGTSA